MRTRDEQFKMMTTDPVCPLIVRLAVPTIISMLITAVYNTADTYFVSQLNKSASGAVGIVMPLMALIQAVGFTLGMGAGSNISRLLGEKQNEKACEYGSKALFAAIALGAVITGVCFIFFEDLLLLLGSTDTILPFARDYAFYILCAAPLFTALFVLNNILRGEGKAFFSMMGVAAGGLLNIIIDPIFINNLSLGIAGAAIATAISQLVSVVILLVPFIFKKTIIRLSFSKLFRNTGVYLQILRIGLPSLLRQGLASLATILLNNSAANISDAAVSAMTIVTKVSMMINSAFIGFGQGFQPVVGYNHGAGLHDRVRRAFMFTLAVGTGLLTVLGIATWIFAERIMNAFIDDSEVVEIGIAALRAQCIATPFMAPGIVTNMVLQSVGKAFGASVLSSARQGLFFIPLILTLPHFFGTQGLIWSQPVADLLTLVAAIPFGVIFLKNLKKAASQ